MTNFGEEQVTIPPSSIVWHMKPPVGEALGDQKIIVEISLDEDEQCFLKLDIPASISPGFYNLVIKDFCYYVIEDYFVVKKCKTRYSKEKVVHRRIQII